MAIFHLNKLIVGKMTVKTSLEISRSSVIPKNILTSSEKCVVRNM